MADDFGIEGVGDDDEMDPEVVARLAGEAHAEAMMGKLNELQNEQGIRDQMANDSLKARLMNFVESLSHEQLDDFTHTMAVISGNHSPRAAASFVQGVCIARHWFVFEMEHEEQNSNMEGSEDQS